MAALSFTNSTFRCVREVFLHVFSFLIFAVSGLSEPIERPSQPADHNPLPPLFLIECPADLTLGIASSNCLATVLLPEPQVLNSTCAGDPKFVISSPLGEGKGPFQNTATGAYRIDCLAFTTCGDTATCSFSLTIRDAKKPTPVLKNAVLGNVTSSGTVRFHARQMNQSSWDNCSASDALHFAFSENRDDTVRIFNCDEMGDFSVAVTVFDEAGNKATAHSRIQIFDGMGYCARTEIFGKIRTVEGLPVSRVSVELENESKKQRVETTDEGHFQNSDFRPGEGCTVTPRRNDDPLNGVNTQDLKLLYKHILGEKKLPTAYHVIAADVNRNGKVTLADLIELRNLILGEQTHFQNNTSWRFVNKSHVFAQPLAPWTPGFPEKIEIQALSKDSTNIEFVGLKTGDLNGDAEPSFNPASASVIRSDQKPIFLIVENQSFKRGETVRVALPAPSAEIDAFQFTLEFDMDQVFLKSVAPGSLSGMGFENIGSAHSGEGALSASWNGDPAPADQNAQSLIMLATFTAAADGQLHDALRISNRITPAQAFDKQGNMYDLKLKFNSEQPAANGGLQLFQNHPNPFIEMTLLRFSVPADGAVTVRVFDATGRKVCEKFAECYAGDNQIMLDKSELDGSGVYAYEIITPFGSASRKLMMF